MSIDDLVEKSISIVLGIVVVYCIVMAVHLAGFIGSV